MYAYYHGRKGGSVTVLTCSSFALVYLVLAIKSTCPRSVDDHEETKEATTTEKPGSRRVSECKGNQKAKEMKKREAKGQASAEGPQASGKWKRRARGMEDT